jgi:hypothetical protein
MGETGLLGNSLGSKLVVWLVELDCDVVSLEAESATEYRLLRFDSDTSCNPVCPSGLIMRAC